MTFFPTNHYPGVYWPTSRQVEAQLPVTAAPPFFDQLTSDNIAASGIRETIVLRSEERRQLTFFGLDALETAQWGQYFTERGGRGQQVELFVDRFMGRQFTFQNTTADQNFGTITSAASIYQVVSGRVGLTTPNSPAGNDVPVSFAANVGSRNAALTNSEGVIVISMISCGAAPDWSWGEGADQSRVSLSLQRTNSSMRATLRTLSFTLVTASLNANWPSGTLVTAIVQWTSGQSLGLWLFVPGSAMAQVTVSLSGTTFLAPVQDTVTVGSLPFVGGTGRGVLFHFATYKKAFDDPTLLASHFPLGRNYYGRAELIERTFSPTRIAPGVDAWQWTWTFRQGF